MNEHCDWEEVYKLNGVSPEYNKPLDDFDIMVEEIETSLSKTEFEEVHPLIPQKEAISI
ncbi:MAG: hypothetical protein ACE5J5_08720 [Candidatus Hydrothermarchaeales archaeon]